MGDSESDKDSIEVPAEEYVSNLTRENAERLIACAEKLADRIERLDDPAVFHVMLSRFKPGE